MAETQETKLLYDRFTSYGIIDPAKIGDPAMAVVPEPELQSLIEFANLAKAAGPANCNHPADSLEAFELISDCCVCGECGAVLKNYTARDAAALGIQPGWNRLTVELLSVEIYMALKPIFDIMEYLQSELHPFNRETRDPLSWSEDYVQRLAQANALKKVR